MQMMIECASGSGPPEVALLEFQGDLKTTDGETLDARVLGQLYYGQDGTPIMTIGHHILHGKVQALPKPLVLMKPCKEAGAGAEGKAVPVYRIYGVAKRKIIFKNRPKPIISPNDVAKK